MMLIDSTHMERLLIWMSGFSAGLKTGSDEDQNTIARQVDDDHTTLVPTRFLEWLLYFQEQRRQGADSAMLEDRGDVLNLIESHCRQQGIKPRSPYATEDDQ